MTSRRIILSCMAVALMGGSALFGAAAGGAAVYAAAHNQLVNEAAPTTSNPVVVNPRAPFRAEAEQRGWEVVQWKERNRPGEPDMADEWGSWEG